jgi:hypothetical protein
MHLEHYLEQVNYSITLEHTEASFTVGNKMKNKTNTTRQTILNTTLQTILNTTRQTILNTTLQTIPISNREMIETETKSATNTQIYFFYFSPETIY